MQCLPVPRGVTLIEAAALPEVAITVWLNVFELAALRPGERLLVHGGASGIGSMAIQLAHALGSQVYATAGSAEKCARCVALGAARAIDYRREDFVAVIAQETGGAGVDVILEMVGGDYLARDMTALAFGGRVAIIALKQGSKPAFDFSMFQRKDAKMMGSRLRPRPIPEGTAGRRGAQGGVAADRGRPGQAGGRPDVRAQGCRAGARLHGKRRAYREDFADDVSS